MKKLFSLIFFSLFTIVAVAQLQHFDFNVVTPGTLKSLIAARGELYIFDMKVTGNIDARDIKCLRDEFTKLIVLDISSITIQPYTGVGGTTSDLIYPANQIPDYSFNNSGNGKTSLISITLPDSITTIGNYAFSNCSGLTKIIIPKQVTLIGIHAFFSSGTQGRSIAEGLVFENRLSSH